ncbi:hypothetical protein RHSIM_RhsimUnG0039500 [Rhododendron simsii]|uniref:non-specific serine/threonine protein kinase n=1 Tax=Rhododendron simsii TaxID=118357 RepID=A0A834G2U8_RHOSS|nr:hypothetical protein RHSIM_RhsimUnG0039500 [Rhododendron simsii]
MEMRALGNEYSARKVRFLDVTGGIPEELWSLTSLTKLDLLRNYLTGPLSSSIANLTQIQWLSLGANALSGEVPKELGKLTNLTVLNIGTNNFSGSLPVEMGYLVKLERLYFDSSGVSGAIPSTFAALQNLQIVLGSDNELTGSIPEFIGNWSELSILNIGTNNFSGSLPSELGNLIKLEELEVKFVFIKYSDFAINCGGPKIKAVNQIVYEWDNETLGPVTYYETSTKRWAVSNVGHFNELNDSQYTSVSSSQFTTLDTVLQTARISPGSLRYFGLGLENGNYSVTLHFAETAILNPQTWKSLGRRVFDIYIQGNLVQKDFDIKKEAGGLSFQAVPKVFPTLVSKNYLEIHLFWAGKGTCCIPAQGTYGPSISAISAVPEFIPTVTSGKKSKIGLIVGIVVPVGVVSFLSLLALYWFVLCRKGPGWDDDEALGLLDAFCVIRGMFRHDGELLGMDVRPYTISYAELKDATEDFNPANKLGEGGFGPVFKGTLNDGRVIAVKQLSVASRQGKDQFVAEIATTSAVQHRNLVKLYGCCIEGNKRLIVYEYLENKSLDQALFGKTSLFLNWPIRFDICLGVARGLAYLHVESRLRIVHRDVKASNILLDSELNPKVSDFGLAKLFDDKKTHISTRVAGTFGYLAPEYAMLGQLTEKADVFGFGVVALEIVSGRPNTDSSLEEEKIYLLKWAWHVHENNREVELVDARLLEFDEEEVKRVIGVALLCTQTSPQQRPSMPRVVAMLSGDIEVSAVTSRPGYFTAGTSTQARSIDLHVSSKYIDPSTARSLEMEMKALGIEYSTRKVIELDVTGGIPEELWSLTSLTHLNLPRNYLTGPLSSSIANLTQLQWLVLTANALSGEVPKELGKLTNLLLLSISMTNFSGSLPSELGNLIKLEQFYFDSSGVSGAIPSTFATLQNLSRVWGSDNELTGSIPEFIGNWSKLSSLRISDLSNGSSSLAFLKDMTSLSTLILRNNNISGTIPSNIGDFKSLSQLFLGNNKLTGMLPALKNPLLHIHGSILICKQMTKSEALAVKYSDFAINCGGPKIKAVNQIVYEWDNETLGPVTYYETSTKRWAVSNVGHFNELNDSQYTSVSSSQFTTLDTVLQTARISPGSLRYFGLGLENGNYSVTLHFAETAILNPQTWKSLGRRVFDIYIQGNLVQKDFDIKKEAGGLSFQAVPKVFPTLVSKNYLEIHLFWAGKGTCCIPAQGTYGPSISAISAVPEFIPTVTSGKKSKIGLIVGIVVPVGVVSFLSLLALYWFVLCRKGPGWDDDEALGLLDAFCVIRGMFRHDGELLGMDVRPYTISYAELKDATEDFNPANKLGEGGFGPVFKGTLNDGRVIAVKQLSVASRQGKDQFVAEIATTSAVQHRNLVKLYGCCIEGNKRLIVYEYLENKSLDQALFGKTSLFLNWPIRFDICLGVARGLAYLHVESRLRIVHRDVKASNILLDSELNPKVSDFGLAKLFDDKKTHISTRVAGTFGYLAPEYAMLGQLTEKADVFGFGVVALEIVSGRPNTDSSLEEEKIYLLKWAWHVHENNREVELVDARLLEFDEEEVKRVIGVALLCTQTSPQQRPSMPRVVAMLSGDIEVSAVTSRPGYFTDWNFDTSTERYPGSGLPTRRAISSHITRQRDPPRKAT